MTLSGPERMFSKELANKARFSARENDMRVLNSE